MYALLLSCICNCIIGTILNWELFFRWYLWFRFEEISSPASCQGERHRGGWLVQEKEQWWFRDISGWGSYGVSEGEWAGDVQKGEGERIQLHLDQDIWFVRKTQHYVSKSAWVSVCVHFHLPGEGSEGLLSFLPAAIWKIRCKTSPTSCLLDILTHPYMFSLHVKSFLESSKKEDDFVHQSEICNNPFIDKNNYWHNIWLSIRACHCFFPLSNSI